LDIVKRVLVRDEVIELDALPSDDVDQTTHTFFAARAGGRNDLLVRQLCTETIEWNRDGFEVDANTGYRMQGA
jgi:hypothetical protein